MNRFHMRILLHRSMRHHRHSSQRYRRLHHRQCLPIQFGRKGMHHLRRELGRYRRQYQHCHQFHRHQSQPIQLGLC